jgi:hypothetical protein
LVCVGSPYPAIAALPMATAEAADGPRPRLIIQQVVTENFKSYAGVQTIGPFHKVWRPLG